MSLRVFPILGTAVLAVSLITVGCAGSKSSSSGGADNDQAGSAKSARVDDARRSAEDAEMKAHQLRQEKARSQAKTSSN